MNSVPFGPGDHDRIRAFSERVNRAFLPRQSGSRPVTVLRGEAAFEEFGRLLRATGKFQAAFAPAEGGNAVEFYFAIVWAAIRAGWRGGYALEAPAQPAIITSL
ncbi:MAG: hypothetical protein M3N54_13195 [Acidobacteriota bacterium]|nr:hypothetical protein [Acidobacteriota bacterium]